MVASSTIKNSRRGSSSTPSEKKKLRLRKDFIANINLLSPDDPAVIEEKASSKTICYIYVALFKFYFTSFETLIYCF